jgi:hypothetical protein
MISITEVPGQNSIESVKEDVISQTFKVKSLLDKTQKMQFLALQPKCPSFRCLISSVYETPPHAARVALSQSAPSPVRKQQPRALSAPRSSCAVAL